MHNTRFDTAFCVLLMFQITYDSTAAAAAARLHTQLQQRTFHFNMQLNDLLRFVN